MDNKLFLKKLIKDKKIPASEGVYIFRGSRNKVLYIGKATSLKNRILSYLSENIEKTRGKRIVNAIEYTKDIEVIETDTVLDAMILEANLIKKYEPQYNVKEKDNKSFWFIVITDEKFPRVLTERGRSLSKIDLDPKQKYKYVFGPFVQGSLLKEALNLLRKIIPYRDTCTVGSKKCFRAQLGLCPGVCINSITEKEYNKNIKQIASIFQGKRKKVLLDLEKEMNKLAKEQKFEAADIVKKRIFALKHIRDANLLKKEFAEGSNMRIEGYDISHTGGDDVVGGMVVMENGELDKKEYRKFNLSGANDVENIKIMLMRRFAHNEWKFPQLIVIDGGKVHKNNAEKELEKIGIKIPVVSIVKTTSHKPREIFGDKKYIYAYERDIIKINKAVHSFVLRSHQKKRLKL